ncbi:MAG: glycosyltransferase [Clostridia bacterium]|nr:glycosyltransferase [Clostridia bacterium]
MNVTVICDVLGQANNGTTIAAMNLIDHLRAKGHKVTVVSPDASTAGREGYMVVPTLNLTAPINRLVEKNNVQLAKADKKILYEAIKDADVVHILIPFWLGCGAVKMARKLGKPITASFHCQAENFTAHIGMMGSKLVNRITYKIFSRKVYRHCVKVHYPTEFIKNVFEKEAGRQFPSVVISNGVDELFFEERKKNPSGKFTIVCSGRYSKEKSQRDLLDAVGMSRHKDEIKIILAGQGPYEKRLRKRASKMGLDVEFRFFERRELAQTLTDADLYVHTSTVEIEAVSAMEAIACGLVPVICDSELSATRSFALDEANLFRKHSPRDLCKKIDFFFENPGKVAEYAARYGAKKNAFRLCECMDRMESMLADACSHPEERRRAP